MKMAGNQDVISPIELEDIVGSLKPTVGIECVGSGKLWHRQISAFEELNVQAAVEADRGGEENVRQCLIDNKKMPLIVHELITVELWRAQVLPRILDMGKPASSFQIYMVLFHEANLVNLLETVLFSVDACCELDDAVLDLADYCVRSLSDLVVDLQSSLDLDDADSNNHDSLTATDLSRQLADWKPGMELPNLPVEDVADEIKRHRRDTSFQIAMKSISILRYLTDHVDELPLGVSTRLAVTHDIPVLLVQLIESKPWIKNDDQIFEGSTWRKCEDVAALSKIEIQVWLALYNILSKKICTEKYEINNYRRRVITKLVNCISSEHVTQLPMLSAFKKWLLQLSLTNATSGGGGGIHAQHGSGGASQQMKANFMIEAVAQLRDNMIRKYETRWEKVAQEQSAVFLGDCAAEMATEVDRLFKAFDSEAAQALILSHSGSPGVDNGKKSGDRKTSGSEDRTSCALCDRANAKQRCSRCRSERYCGRECQVQHWPEHKKYCK